MDTALLQHICGHLVYDCRYDPEFLQVAVACCHSEEDAMLIARSVQPFLSKAPMTQFSARLFLVMCARQTQGLAFAISVVKAYGSTLGDECRAFRELLHIVARCCRTTDDFDKLRRSMSAAYRDAGYDLPSALHLAVLSGQSGLGRQCLPLSADSTGIRSAFSSLRSWSSTPTWQARIGASVPAVCTSEAHGAGRAAACVCHNEGGGRGLYTDWPSESWSSPCISCMCMTAVTTGEGGKEALDTLRQHVIREVHPHNYQLLILQNAVDRALYLASCCSLGYTRLGDASAAQACMVLARNLLLSVSASTAAQRKQGKATATVTVAPMTILALTAATLLAGTDRFFSSLTVIRLYSALLSVRGPAPWASSLELSMLLSPTLIQDLTPPQVAVLQAQVITLLSRVEQAVGLPLDMHESELSSIVHDVHGERDMSGRLPARVMSIYGDTSIEAAAEAVEAYVRVGALPARQYSTHRPSAEGNAGLEAVAARIQARGPAHLPSVAALAVTPTLYVNNTASTGQSKSAPAPGTVHIFDDIVLEPRDDVSLETLLEVRARLQMRGALAVDTAAEEELPQEIQERNPYAIAHDVVGLELLSFLARLESSPIRHILTLPGASVRRKGKDTRPAHSITSSLLYALRLGTGERPSWDDFNLNDALPGRPLRMALQTALLAASDERSVLRLADAQKMSKQVMAELEQKLEQQSSSSASDTEGEGDLPMSAESFQSLHLLSEAGAVLDVLQALRASQRGEQGKKLQIWRMSDSSLYTIAKSVASLCDVLSFGAQKLREHVTHATISQATVMQAQAGLMTIEDAQRERAHWIIDKVQAYVLALSSPPGEPPQAGSDSESAVAHRAAWESAVPLFRDMSVTAHFAHCPAQLLPAPPTPYFLPKGLMVTATGRAIHYMLLTYIHSGGGGLPAKAKPVMCAGGRPPPSQWSHSLLVMEKAIKCMDALSTEMRALGEETLQLARSPVRGRLVKLSRKAEFVHAAHDPVKAVVLYIYYLNWRQGISKPDAVSRAVSLASTSLLDSILRCIADETMRAMALDRHFRAMAKAEDEQGLKGKLMAALQKILAPRESPDNDTETTLDRPRELSLHLKRDFRSEYGLAHSALLLSQMRAGTVEESARSAHLRAIWLAFSHSAPTIDEVDSTVLGIHWRAARGLYVVRRDLRHHVRRLRKETAALERGEIALATPAQWRYLPRMSNAAAWLHLLLELTGDAAMLGIPLSPATLHHVCHVAGQAMFRWEGTRNLGEEVRDVLTRAYTRAEQQTASERDALPP